MNLSSVLDFNRLAQERGRARRERRSLFDLVAQREGRHMVGITGPRGAGKTILLQQLASERDGACYVSLDTLPRDTDLFELVRALSERFRFKEFFLDEVHYLDDALGGLKRIYDFLEVRVTFTSSVALGMRASAHDLARRVRLHSLDYFSFREFLRLKHGERLPLLSLDDLLEGRISPQHLQAEDRFDAYLTGGLMPFAMEEPEPLPLLEATIETIINRDIPNTLRLHVDELETLKRMMAFVGRSGIDGINYTSLSSNLGITKYKAEQYVGAFESAYLMQRLLPCGTNVLKEPKVLLMPPIRVLYRPVDEARGGLREDFFALAMRQAGLAIDYLKGARGQKTPDFLIDHNGQSVVFEVGGKGKGRTQFKGVSADRKIVLAEGAEMSAVRMPLHLIGMLA